MRSEIFLKHMEIVNQNLLINDITEAKRKLETLCYKLLRREQVLYVMQIIACIDCQKIDEAKAILSHNRDKIDSLAN